MYTCSTGKYSFNARSMKDYCGCAGSKKSVADGYSTVKAIEWKNHLWKETLEATFLQKVWSLDCLNTRYLDEAKLKRKPNLKWYFKPDGDRLHVNNVHVAIIYYLRAFHSGDRLLRVSGWLGSISVSSWRVHWNWEDFLMNTVDYMTGMK